MDAKLIDEDYIRRAAAAVGLELARSHVPGVTAYFQMIAAFAATVNEFPLDEMTENALVFTPCSRTTQE